MPRIYFKGREIVVKQVQRSLGLKDDGNDGRVTWQAIVSKLLDPVPQIAASRSFDFPGRESITKRVQRALGNILDDGCDGSETWAALAEHFDPDLREAEIKPFRQIAPASGKYSERVVSSPNRSASINERKGCVIHHASGYYEGTVSWCLQRGTNAAYHVLINTDGQRTIMGEDTARLYHSGESSFRGRKFCNAFMLGLAFIGNTNDGAMRGAAGRDLTADEVASALEWLKPRMAKYGWTKEDVTAHRIVSPGRKDDTSLKALQQILVALT